MRTFIYGLILNQVSIKIEIKIQISFTFAKLCTFFAPDITSLITNRKSSFKLTFFTLNARNYGFMDFLGQTGNSSADLI